MPGTQTFVDGDATGWITADFLRGITLLAQPDPGIDREGRYRRVSGPRCDIGKTPTPPRGAAQDRRPSQYHRLERAAGYRIIVPRRARSAHFHHRLPE